MEIADFDEVFFRLDFNRRGYLSKEQIQAYDETLNVTKLCTPQVEAAVSDVCGLNSDGFVRQEHFVPVLQELQRRRQLENQIQWDFMALDNNGSHLITIQDALILFQTVQGNQFSIQTWNKFVNSRQDPSADVSFDEVRLWLCSQPGTEPSNEQEVSTEKERLKHLKEERTEEEFSKLQNYKVDEYTEARSKEEYNKMMKALARRKQYVWETKGIGALLFDDDQDLVDDMSSHTLSSISINDVIDALHNKYDIIRKKLFEEMLQNHYGTELWLSMNKGEQVDALEQLQLEERLLRQEGQLSEKSSELLGAKITKQIAPLNVLIGDLPEHFNANQAILMQKILDMQKDGKSEKDIEKTLRKEFKSSFQVERSDQTLIALNEREQMEYDYYMKTLNSDSKKQPEIRHAYMHLLRQYLMATEEKGYLATVVAVGLAEYCKGYNVPSIDPIRQKHEILAKERLLHVADNTYQPPDIAYNDLPENASLLDLQLAVIREVTLKHQQEHKVFGVMLTGKDSLSSKTASQVLDANERQSHIITLRNARNNWKENIMTTSSKRNWTILQEAVGIYWITKYEEHQNRSLDTTDTEVNASILADLQQNQDDEFHNMLNGLFRKTEKELLELLRQQQEAYSQEVYDNIAAVVLGTSSWSDDEMPLIDAVELKYDMLRQLCLRHQLRLEYGLGWSRLGESEKDKLLIKKRVEEKKLRQEGKLAELSDVIRLIPKDIGTVQSLLGEDRNAYNKHVSLKNQKIEELMKRGEKIEEDAVDYEETSPTNVKSLNLLADLLPRQQAEQEAVIRLYRSLAQGTMSEQAKLLPVVLVKVEKSLAKKEEWFDIGALSVGLFERIEEALNIRHKADRERQEKLAKLRINKRIARIQTMEPYYRETDTVRPETGDIQGWMVALLREIKKKHSSECEMFLNILQDPGMEELYDAATTMSAEEQTNRLLELRSKWFGLNMEHSDFQEENVNILEEAAAIRTVQKKAELEKAKVDASTEAISVQLLVELQHKQDQEVAEIIKRLGNMTEEAMKLNREHQIKCRHQMSSENIVFIFTKYTGSAQDDELLKTLKEKHEAMVDKLLLEALIKQVGEADWLRMTELERQKRLAALKIQARKFQQEGKEIELMRLLNQSKEDQERIQKLLGDNKAEFLRKLEERRRRCKELGVEDEDVLEEEDIKPVNPLTALDERFQAEKEALLATLKGTNEKFMTERERQMALIELKREKRRAEKEGTFDEIAEMIGLAERQQAELNERLKNDRQRQEDIARRRLEAMKKQKKSAAKSSKVPALVDNGDRVTLQDTVMLRLEEKHEDEQQLLVKLLNKLPPETVRKQLEAISEPERQLVRNNLHKKLDNLPQSDVKACIAVLQEACYSKFESRKQSLQQTSDQENIEKDYIDVTLMADLQDCQDKESVKYLHTMKDMEYNEIIDLQKKILDEIRFQRGHCLIDVLFSSESQGKLTDNEVICALEEKYDILREKLLTEALEKQVGEKAWKKMSDEERAQNLEKLKQQEKELRQQGQLDEAAELLGLLKEEQDGQKINPLQQLEDSFENEKKKLLNALEQQKNQVEAERQRQLQLAQLRRDQRKVQLESHFEAAALVVDLGKKHEQAVEDIRQKQEKLAKERLAAELKKRKERGKKSQSQQEPEPSVDVTDKMSLIESIFEQVEKKHLKEREFLIELYQEASLADTMKVVQEHSFTEQSQRLEELKQLWKTWRQQEIANSEEATALIKEALCLYMMQVKHQLEVEGKPSSFSDLQVAVLADLQELQDKETQQLLKDVENQTPYTLRHLRMSLMLAIKNQWHDNVTAVVFGSGLGTSNDDMLMQALEDKYDTIREKLFTEVLMQEMGAVKWNKLSEQEQKRLIIKLKQQYNQLVSDGKQDEADKLLAALKDRDKELQHKLGNNEESGEQMNNEDNKRKHVMQQLDNHFEEAKAQLLKQLQDHDSCLSSEHEKQMEILKLRRQKRQLEQEERFGAAAILLNMAEQNEKARQESVAQEIERQKALAKERLEAMKQRRKKKTDQSELEKQVKVEKDKLEAEQAEDVLNQKTKGVLALKEGVLSAMEKKHHKEREMLEELITASKDPSATTQTTKAAINLGMEDVIDQLEKLHKEWDSWKSKSKQLARQLSDRGKEDEEQHVKEITENFMKELHLLTQALVLKMEVEKSNLKKSGKETSNTDEDVLLMLIRELQQKQDAESRAAEGLVDDKPADVLLKLKELQQKATLEGWYDNLASILFSVNTHGTLPTDDGRIQEEEKTKLQELLAKMQNEFQEEKLKQQQENGDEVNANEEMEKLEAKQNAMKQAICDSFNKKSEQKRTEKEAEQHLLQTEDYEKLAVTALLKMMEEDDSPSGEKKSTDAEKKDKNLLQQKLEERRQRRKLDQGTAVRMSSAGRRSSPEPSLSRERTVIDVALSEDQKNELYEQLMQQQQVLDRKLESEHKRHEQLLKERLEKMKEKRSHEAADLLRMAERQKTTLQKHKDDEHKRQLEATKERVARLRREKTMTMNEQRMENTRKFDQFLNEKELSGLSKDEQTDPAQRKTEPKIKEEDTMEEVSRQRHEERIIMLKERLSKKKKKFKT